MFTFIGLMVPVFSVFHSVDNDHTTCTINNQNFIDQSNTETKDVKLTLSEIITRSDDKTLADKVNLCTGTAEGR